MSDMYSKRPASQSPQSSEKRDAKRPTGLQANDLLSDAEHQQCDKQVKDYFEGIGLTISLKNPAQKALLLSSVVTYDRCVLNYGIPPCFHDDGLAVSSTPLDLGKPHCCSTVSAHSGAFTS